MFIDKDNQIVNDENPSLRITILSVLGDRSNQQDTYGYSFKEQDGLAVICDGMGGHEGGQIASRLAVDHILGEYKKRDRLENPALFLVETVKECDNKIVGLTKEDGTRLNAGSTCVSIIVQDGCLYWCSVGDSRAYLSRGDECVQLTQDQNYGTVLREQLKAGVIDEKTFHEEEGKSEALISYLGIGNLSLIDYNDRPLKLEKGDKIVLMSDGMYKVLPEEEFRGIIGNFKNTEEALQALEDKMQRFAARKEISRDNTTAMIVTVK